MAIRLTFAALLALSLGACGTFDMASDSGYSGASDADGYARYDDDFATSGGGLSDDCYMRRVGSESAVNSLVCN